MKIVVLTLGQVDRALLEGLAIYPGRAGADQHAIRSGERERGCGRERGPHGQSGQDDEVARATHGFLPVQRPTPPPAGGRRLGRYQRRGAATIGIPAAVVVRGVWGWPAGWSGTRRATCPIHAQ